jgi:predicted ATPase
LRGNPARSYPRTAIGPRFPGTFDNYVASLISHWSEADSEKLQGLNDDLVSLGLTWKVEAKPLNDAQVELRVGRLRKPKPGGGKDLVNIADVGFGVSQTLPVVVALRAAEPGQLVYIEQPEIHLHPRAQVAMAEVLGKAALRGVRVVVETHSSMLLLAVQTLVAQGALDPKLVMLNWFRRDDEGATHIHAAELDEAGRFGDWPEDFAEVALETEDRFLTAAEGRLSEVGDGG